MNRVASSTLNEYGVACGVSLLAAGLALLISPVIPQIPFVLSILAVLISALYGGRGPGLLATVVGASVGAYLTVPRADTGGFTVLENLLWFGLSVLIMFLITYLNAVRKRGQEALLRLAAIVESSDDAIIGQGLDGAIASWNSGAQRIYGYRAQEVVGCSTSIIVPSERAAELPESFERLTQGGHFYQVESQHRRKDGQIIDVSLAISRITGPQGKLIGFSTISRDITDTKKAQAERERLFAEVSAGVQRLQVLSKQLMDAQEIERRHIALELHDEIGQALTAVKINLQSAQRTLSAAANYQAEASTALPAGEVRNASFESFDHLSRSLQGSIALVERTLQQIRDLSLDLRPSVLDDLGLVAALRWYVDRFSQQTGLATEFKANLVQERLAPEIEIACFRVVQQALTNITRHAQAKHVRVDLRDGPDVIELLIQDDGVGFDVQAARARAVRGGSLGLLGMQERAQAAGGKLDIQSTVGQGAAIVASFPLLAPETRQE